MTGAEGEMENKRRARQGFTLVALMVMLAVAAVIMMSPEYIGRATRDAEIQLTERIARDLTIAAEAIKWNYMRQMKCRSGLESEETIMGLWNEENIKDLVLNYPGIGTFSTSIGEDKDLPSVPVIETKIVKTETLPDGRVVPSLVSVNITVKTNRPMYAHTVRDVQNRFMKSANITNVRFDFVDKRELQITVMVGQNISRFNPLSF